MLGVNAPEFGLQGDSDDHSGAEGAGSGRTPGSGAGASSPRIGVGAPMWQVVSSSFAVHSRSAPDQDAANEALRVTLLSIQILRRRLHVSMLAINRWAAPTVLLLVMQVTGTLAITVAGQGAPFFVVWYVVSLIGLLLLLLILMARVTQEYSLMYGFVISTVQATSVLLDGELLRQVQLLASGQPDAVRIAGMTINFSLVSRFAYVAGSVILVAANIHY